MTELLEETRKEQTEQEKGRALLDTLRQCEAVNALYDQLLRYYNLFQPVLHLTGKEVVDGKLKRRWDRARTPYQRLLASGVLAPEQAARLAALYAGTNPRQLREDIYRAVAGLWQHPQARAGDQGKRACLSLRGRGLG